MPFVRIDTIQGRYSQTERAEIGEGIYQALLGVGALEDDRFQVFTEKPPGMMSYGPII